MQIEGSRLSHEFHICLTRKLIALLSIAGMAAGYKIFPTGSTPT
jgi:hypothetical protein